MTCLTINYKKHYIHISNTNKSEEVTVQLFDNPLDNYSPCKIYKVKSLQAAKLFITKYINSPK